MTSYGSDLATLTSLQNDSRRHCRRVREAIDALDTEACDRLEDALVSWGTEGSWPMSPSSCP